MTRGRYGKRKTTAHPHPKKETIMAERPHFQRIYPNWMATENIHKSTYDAVVDLIKDEKVVNVRHVAEAVGVSAMPVLKVLYKEGWLMLEDGRRQSESNWMRASNEERAEVIVLEPTNIKRIKAATGPRVVRVARTTTTATTQHDELEVAGQDDSWPLDLTGRETMTIDQLQDAVSLLGLTLEIRVRHA